MSLLHKFITVRYQGNNRTAYVVRESEECVYVQFWSRRRNCWDTSSMPKSGHEILRKHIVGEAKDAILPA